MNYVILGGRLVKDCELTKTPKGMAITKFTVAVNDYVGGQETTSFIVCKAFSKVAETIEKHFHKGDTIVINGRLNQNKFKDKNGKPISLLEVIVNDFMFIGAKKETKEDNPVDAIVEPEPVEEVPLEDLKEEDLPF